MLRRRAGINMDAVKQMGQIIKDAAQRTEEVGRICVCKARCICQCGGG